MHIPAREGNVTLSSCFALWCAVISASGCATAELTQHVVDEPAETTYRDIRVNVILTDTADTKYVTNRVVAELQLRDTQILPLQQSAGTSIHAGPAMALLKIEEIDRRMETVVYHRKYGRTALTQMRGRELHDKPVITLRATLSDARSGQTVFQADFVTQGPWYVDSAAVVATLARPLVEQLEHEGFVAPQQ